MEYTDLLKTSRREEGVHGVDGRGRLDALCANEFPAQSAVTRDLTERTARSRSAVVRRLDWLAGWSVGWQR